MNAIPSNAYTLIFINRNAPALVDRILQIIDENPLVCRVEIVANLKFSQVISTVDGISFNNKFIHVISQIITVFERHLSKENLKNDILQQLGSYELAPHQQEYLNPLGSIAGNIYLRIYVHKINEMVTTFFNGFFHIPALAGT